MYQDSQESDKMAVNGHATILCVLFGSGVKITSPICSRARQNEEPLLLCVIGGGHGWLERAYLW